MTWGIWRYNYGKWVLWISVFQNLQNTFIVSAALKVSLFHTLQSLPSPCYNTGPEKRGEHEWQVLPHTWCPVCLLPPCWSQGSLYQWPWIISLYSQHPVDDTAFWCVLFPTSFSLFLLPHDHFTLHLEEFTSVGSFSSWLSQV